jgi:hypothetical protein
MLALDISDAQDEASYWVDGPSHPIRNPAIAGVPGSGGEHRPSKWSRRFQLTSALDEIVRRCVTNRVAPPASVTERQRSAVTWANWEDLNRSTAWEDGGYLPLGVQGGLDRISSKVSEIARLAESSGAHVVVLLYPWPGQLTNEERFSWDGFARQLCAKAGCSVVDTIPRFQAAKSASLSWYSELYANGDTHLSANGNRIVAEALAEYVHSVVATPVAYTTTP